MRWTTRASKTSAQLSLRRGGKHEGSTVVDPSATSGYEIAPLSRLASLLASVREDTFSFRSTAATCFSAVRGDMNSRSAI
jgi:hypothetical protein